MSGKVVQVNNEIEYLFISLCFNEIALTVLAFCPCSFAYPNGDRIPGGAD